MQRKQRKPKSILAEWLGVGNSVKVKEMIETMQINPNENGIPENEDDIEVDEDAQQEEDKRVK